MDRQKLKCNLATALSDMGLLTKLPLGRVDLLVDRLSEAPEEFGGLARTGIGPAKGSAAWRVCESWAQKMAVQTPRERKPRAARVRQVSYGRVTFDEFGGVRFRATLRREMRDAVRDYGRDNPDAGLGHDVCRDLAEGMLALEGVPVGTPHFRAATQALAEHGLD